MPPHAVRWVKDQAYFLLVLAALVAGFGYLILSSGHWLRATFVMGCAMVLAAGLRAFVSDARIGLLSVRGTGVGIPLEAVPICSSEARHRSRASCKGHHAQRSLFFGGSRTCRRSGSTSPVRFRRCSWRPASRWKRRRCVGYLSQRARRVTHPLQ